MYCKVLATVLMLLLAFPSVTGAEGLRFYGDISLSRGIMKFVREKGEPPVRSSLDAFLRRDAIHIANLEGAVGREANCKPGHEPCFPVDGKLLGLLEGFDIIGLENNHSMDLGVQGLSSSMRELEKRGVKPLGGKKWSAVVPTRNGNMGIIAVTDRVNAPSDRGYLAMAESPGVLSEIARLRGISSVVAVYVHWGRELDNLPTERMKALARAYVLAGADLVVGTHPHVAGQVECIRGKPVVYSLGNFLFDQKYEDTKKGAVLDCGIDDQSRLACRLAAHRTPMNWYLPRPAPGDQYREENAALSACMPEVRKTWTGRFTRDGREKRLVLSRERASATLGHMELFDRSTGALEKKTPPMPILGLQPVDLDSDGIQEVALVQRIYSSLDREVARRVYLYSFKGGFHALWRGSGLSRPLRDAIFVTGKDGRPVLLALHSPDSFLVRDPGMTGSVIMGYRWNGFGFDGGRRRKLDYNAEKISIRHGKIRLIRREEAVGEVDASEMQISEHTGRYRCFSASGRPMLR